MKQHLVYTGSTDYHSPIFLTLPSFYHCRELTLTNVVGVASTSLSTCYVLAEGERMLRTLNLTPSEIQGERDLGGILDIFNIPLNIQAISP